jgi:hypothetical protein
VKLNLDREKIQTTIGKNTTTSYGLTVVIGLPFPAEINERIKDIQIQLESLAPGRFTFYDLDHLHATLVAPLRGRYRASPPLQRTELPTNLRGFIRDLAHFFSQQQPYSIELASLHITPEGFAMIGENSLIQQLAVKLERYPELDPAKYLKGIHVAIGFFNTPQPFATYEEQGLFEAALTQLRSIPVGQVMVQQVWLVHYANRTLNHIVGKVSFSLGKPNIITIENLLQKVGIFNI